MTETRPSRCASATRLALAAVGVAMALTACSHSSDPTPPKPSSSASSPTTAAPDPAWESAFSDAQLDVFREAVRRAEAYETKAQAFFAAGEATPEAKEFFQDNLMTWQVRWADLKSYEQQGIKIAHSPKVLSSEAASINLLKRGAADISIQRCVDATNLGGTINGEPLAEGATEPVIQKVDVHKFPDRTWRMGSFVTTEQPCDG